MIHDRDRADQLRLLAALLATRPAWHEMTRETMAALLGIDDAPRVAGGRI